MVIQDDVQNAAGENIVLETSLTSLVLFYKLKC